MFTFSATSSKIATHSNVIYKTRKVTFICVILILMKIDILISSKSDYSKFNTFFVLL